MEVPTEWDYLSNSPNLLGKVARVTVDGEEVSHVRAWDMDAGWVRALCTGQKHYHPEEPHMDPEVLGTEEVCEVTLEGEVEVVLEGQVRDVVEEDGTVRRERVQ